MLIYVAVSGVSISPQEKLEQPGNIGHMVVSWGWFGDPGCIGISSGIHGPSTQKLACDFVCEFWIVFGNECGRQGGSSKRAAVGGAGIWSVRMDVDGGVVAVAIVGL